MVADVRIKVATAIVGGQMRMVSSEVEADGVGEGLIGNAVLATVR